MHYTVLPRKKFIEVAEADLKRIEIYHSLPAKVDPEILEPVVWYIEYRIPLDLLQIYAPLTPPRKGTVWRANFYKIAEQGSNPHWITWSPVPRSKPDFHLPQFFGTLVFD